jgi:predicted transcriptional regulator
MTKNLLNNNKYSALGIMEGVSGFGKCVSSVFNTINGIRYTKTTSKEIILKQKVEQYIIDEYIKEWENEEKEKINKKLIQKNKSKSLSHNGTRRFSLYKILELLKIISDTDMIILLFIYFNKPSLQSTKKLLHTIPYSTIQKSFKKLQKLNLIEKQNTNFSITQKIFNYLKSNSSEPSVLISNNDVINKNKQYIDILYYQYLWLLQEEQETTMINYSLLYEKGITKTRLKKLSKLGMIEINYKTPINKLDKINFQDKNLFYRKLSCKTPNIFFFPNLTNTTCNIKCTPKQKIHHIQQFFHVDINTTTTTTTIKCWNEKIFNEIINDNSLNIDEIEFKYDKNLVVTKVENKITTLRKNLASQNQINYLKGLSLFDKHCYSVCKVKESLARAIRSNELKRRWIVNRNHEYEFNPDRINELLQSNFFTK